MDRAKWSEAFEDSSFAMYTFRDSTTTIPRPARWNREAENDQVGLMATRIPIPRAEIAALCRRWKIIELALFGSVLRDDFGPDSDVDVLVRFDPRARHTLLDIVQIQDELSSALGRGTDLIERAAV